MELPSNLSGPATEDREIYIAPELRAELTQRNLLTPLGTILLDFGAKIFQDEILFNVHGGRDFVFILRFLEGYVELHRNGQTAKVSLPSPQDVEVRLLLKARWNPEELEVQINDKSGIRTDKVQTQRTLPPQFLKAWLQRRANAPVTAYPTWSAVFDSVVDQLQHVRDRVVDIAAVNGFWDVRYSGRSIQSRTPKQESRLRGPLQLLLSDWDYLRALNLVPERGHDGLNFLAHGRAKQHGVVTVCVRFKTAHADLVADIDQSMPEFMRRNGTDLGVFCVLHFGTGYPHLPTFSPELTHYDLETALTLHVAGSSRRFLRTLVFDVSKRPPPSKA